MHLKKYVIALILFTVTSCGLTDAIESVNCIADHNDPEILTAYSDALVALANDPENPTLCQEFQVAIDNYIEERIAYAKCLRDSGSAFGEDAEAIENDIADLEAQRDASNC